MLSFFQIPNKFIHRAIHIKAIERQWATAVSTVKSNYFRFATIVNLVHNQSVVQHCRYALPCYRIYHEQKV